MTVDRRQFIKLAGIASVLGVSGHTVKNVMAGPYGRVEPLDSALTAKRWAMVIDLRKLDSATIGRCVEACHREHNVPVIDDPRHEVKWIWTAPFHHAFPSHENEYLNEDLEHTPIPVFCNHCDNPPCVRVCPTKATWKREDGIVMMDWHRCIGCRYCIAACPYGSRSFNWVDPRPYLEGRELNKKFPTRTKGVVEKCTFCDERLSRGLEPACVEACGNDTLVFGDLEDQESRVRKILAHNFSVRRKPALGTQPEIYYLV